VLLELEFESQGLVIHGHFGVGIADMEKNCSLGAEDEGRIKQ